MNTRNLRCAAVLLPALAMGIPMANASDTECDCPCESDRTTVFADTDQNTISTDMDRDNGYDDMDGDTAYKDMDRDDDVVAAVPPVDSDGNSEWSDDSELLDDPEWSDNEVANNGFVETMPDSGYHSDNLVGQEVTNRSNDETVGEISNLVLDENGQVVAVILSVGGVLGIGEREVAIAWDQIERTVDGDDIKLFVNLTEERLEDAPEYSNDNTFDRQ